MMSTPAPFDDRNGVIWMDGQLLPWRDAHTHVLTHGLHYASSVFEGDRMYNGEIYALTRHSERLKASAQMLGFDIPLSVAEIDSICREVCAANGITDGYVRPLAWRGSEMMAISAQQTTIHVMVAAWEWPSYFSPEVREQGIRLMTTSWRRPPPDCAPVFAKAAGLYSICTLSKHAAEAEGYTDALMLDYRGHVAEATGANIFFEFNDDGVLHTPVADCFLNGITRRSVIDLAQKRGIEVRERTILPEELADASQVFLTGTAAEITPVGGIDAHTYAVRDMTRTLWDDYQELVGKVR